MDGAADKITWMYDTCHKYGIKVLLDVHAMKDSQNGFDNSGMTSEMRWSDDTHFSHWPNAKADWIGDWDVDAGKYTRINTANVEWSLKNSADLLVKWGSHPAHAAFEPVNEPWWNTPLDTLKDFYRQARKLVQTHAPDTKFVFHNSFVYNAEAWDDLFPDGDHADVVMDHH